MRWNGSALPNSPAVVASNLSGGQQQRGAIARSLVQGAKVLFADEPIASLDPGPPPRKVMELLRELNKSDDLTVVVTLHQVDYAPEILRPYGRPEQGTDCL